MTIHSITIFSITGFSIMSLTAKLSINETQYSAPQNLTLSCSASFFTDMLGCHYPQSRYTESRGASDCNLFNG